MKADRRPAGACRLLLLVTLIAVFLRLANPTAVREPLTFLVRERRADWERVGDERTGEHRPQRQPRLHPHPEQRHRPARVHAAARDAGHDRRLSTLLHNKRFYA
jgi:hypothetical protein